MSTILYEIRNRVAIITLNRPKKRNALNEEVVGELSMALAEVEANNSVRAIILKANGNTFCSGADLDQLKAMQSNTYEENLADSTQLKNLFYKIYTLSKIVIAQVEGYALAGGCGLATVCDFTFATPDSKFGYTEARIGFVPAVVMVFLVRKLGEKKASQLLLSADIISAEEAFHLGMVNKIFSKTQISLEVLSFTEKLISQNSAASMATTKQMLTEIQNLSLEDALNYAARQNAIGRGTDDCRRGIQAFLEKREMKW